MNNVKPTSEDLAKMKDDAEAAKFKTFSEKWKTIGLSTEKTDPVRAMAAIKKLYEANSMHFPAEYVLYDSPQQAITKMKELHDVDVSSNDFLCGSMDATWLSTYDYFLNSTKHSNIKEYQYMEAMIELGKCCGWYLVFDELVVLTHRPKTMKFDENDMSHCENGMAIEYRDGFGVAMWHGVQIPKEWIFDKSSITPEVIANCENEEQRQAAREIIAS